MNSKFQKFIEKQELIHLTRIQYKIELPNIPAPSLLPFLFFIFGKIYVKKKKEESEVTVEQGKVRNCTSPTVTFLLKHNHGKIFSLIGKQTNMSIFFFPFSFFFHNNFFFFQFIQSGSPHLFKQYF